MSQLFVVKCAECKKTGSRCIAQAALQRLFKGAIPLLSGTGALTCSVSDLGRCTPPQTTWWSRAPPGAPYQYRTQCGHPIGIVRCSTELLNSNDPPASASRQLGLQAPATAPGERHLHSSEFWDLTKVMSPRSRLQRHLAAKTRTTMLKVHQTGQQFHKDHALIMPHVFNKDTEFCKISLWPIAVLIYAHLNLLISSYIYTDS